MPARTTTRSFLLDAGLPAETAARLRRMGIDAIDAWDEGLGEGPAVSLVLHASRCRRVVVTRDLALATIERPADFPGLLLVSIAEETPESVVRDAVVECVRRYLDARDASLTRRTRPPSRARSNLADPD